MDARVQRSSIVDSCGIGRSSPTAWCFVQAGFPFKAGPISHAQWWSDQNRHFARESRVPLGQSRTWQYEFRTALVSTCVQRPPMSAIACRMRLGQVFPSVGACCSLLQLAAACCVVHYVLATIQPRCVMAIGEHCSQVLPSLHASSPGVALHAARTSAGQLAAAARPFAHERAAAAAHQVFYGLHRLQGMGVHASLMHVESRSRPANHTPPSSVPKIPVNRCRETLS